MLEMTITLEGGMKVDAHVPDFTIKTDQAKDAGGDASAPEPYLLFLASIGACAGVYVLGFCKSREIPTDGIQLVQKHEFDVEANKLSKIAIEIHVPREFPAKYHRALVRAANICAVKKTILNPPEFDVYARVVG